MNNYREPDPQSLLFGFILIALGVPVFVTAVTSMMLSVDSTWSVFAALEHQRDRTLATLLFGVISLCSAVAVITGIQTVTRKTPRQPVPAHYMPTQPLSQ